MILNQAGCMRSSSSSLERSNHLTICLKAEESLCYDGRSQDLPAAGFQPVVWKRKKTENLECFRNTRSVARCVSQASRSHIAIQQIFLKCRGFILETYLLVVTHTILTHSQLFYVTPVRVSEQFHLFKLSSKHNKGCT